MEHGPSLNDTSRAAIAVVGGATMDLVYETERMPGPDESLDALSLVYKCGDEGSNTAVAIYRAQHDEPKSLLDHVNAVTSTASSADGDVSNDQKRDEVKVYLNTAVGDDTFGKQLMNNLVQNGIDVSGVHTLEDDQTGTCAVFVETLTGRSRDIGFPGANTNWLPLDQDSVECLAGGNKADLIVTHLENDPKVVESVLETASKNGVETLLNPSPVYHMPSAIYKKVTHLVMNEIEAAKLAGLSREVVTEESLLEVCTHFRELGVKHVVITQVHRGAFYATEGAYGLVEAVKNVEVKDTTGAGQKRREQPWDIREACERGCKAAAKTLEQLGAQESIPWADEIDIVDVHTA